LRRLAASYAISYIVQVQPTRIRAVTAASSAISADNVAFSQSLMTELVAAGGSASELAASMVLSSFAEVVDAEPAASTNPPSTDDRVSGVVSIGLSCMCVFGIAMVMLF